MFQKNSILVRTDAQTILLGCFRPLWKGIVLLLCLWNLLFSILSIFKKLVKKKQRQCQAGGGTNRRIPEPLLLDPLCLTWAVVLESTSGLLAYKSPMVWLPGDHTWWEISPFSLDEKGKITKNAASLRDLLCSVCQAKIYLVEEQHKIVHFQLFLRTDGFRWQL